MPPAAWDRKGSRQELLPQQPLSAPLGRAAATHGAAAGDGGGPGGIASGASTARVARAGGPGVIRGAVEASRSTQGSAVAGTAATATAAPAPAQAGGLVHGAARWEAPNLVMSSAFRCA